MTATVRAEKGELPDWRWRRRSPFSARCSFSDRATRCSWLPRRSAGSDSIFAARRPASGVDHHGGHRVHQCLWAFWRPDTGIPFFPASFCWAYSRSDSRYAIHSQEPINGWTVVCGGFLVVYLATERSPRSEASISRSPLPAWQRNTRLRLRHGGVGTGSADRAAMDGGRRHRRHVGNLLCTLTVINQVVYGGSMPLRWVRHGDDGVGRDDHDVALRRSACRTRTSGAGTWSWGYPWRRRCMTRALRAGRRATAVAMWILALSASCSLVSI